MKYLAVYFITAIAATTLVNSNAVYKGEERQSCDVNRLQSDIQGLQACAGTYSMSCSSFGSDICGCCRSTLAGGSTGTPIYSCCATFRDLVSLIVPCANQAGGTIPDQIKNCNLGGGATDSY